MKLEEYKEWLKEKGNNEEVMAYEIAKKIIWWHDEGRGAEEEIFPRHILTEGNERIEFDLLIKLKWETNGRTYERLVGVEFKETDMKKVIMQAIRRRDYVDYMYIATRNLLIDFIDLFHLADFQIGWLIYDEEDRFVKLLVPSRMKYSMAVTELIRALAEKAVNEAVREKKSEIMTLADFIS